jgi:2-dehydropantoate 2-reductase
VKIAIAGAGAMGSLFGGRLSLAGFDVRLIEVNIAYIAAVQRDGLKLETEAGVSTIRAPIGPAQSFAEPVDLLMVFTKGPQTLHALRAVRHLIGPQTWALSLQNGLGNGERLATAVSADRVIIGMTNWPADVKAPGHVSSHGTGEVRLWSLNGQPSARLSEISQALSEAGLNSSADPQVMVAIWEKAAFNAAMNSIAAVTGFTVGEMADDADLRALAVAVAAETSDVAHARAIDVDQARICNMLDHAFADHRSHKPSMLQDILNKRRTEIACINGAIVEEAAKGQIAVPVTQTLLRLVRAKERQFL